ncbi:CoA transferase [Biomaibacter acetigenes]|uniref:CoA transferase n=1 Tax=Biomaibacter acetigenes TaxID=2316383 RepID=A0A3G2R7P7_9FIRM|nr:CaiB/BaiF CoA-transferase family protein [Biomaibacter acetigenes]AYO31405.1 CoA transferase [Biomaibacter acetigenes]
MKPLEGIKVLDLSRVLAGPFATMVLGDLGAEIIKIEIPDVGDDSRSFGPFIKDESAYFMSINRNKKSMTLNLKKPEGVDILKKLVRKADVIVENYRPGTMEKLGIGYNVLKEINPKIIYAACSGFGHTGPYSQRPAYDVIVQGMGGIMSITGQPGGPPTRVGASIGDITAALFTAIGVLAALNVREKTGKGQKVDVAMLDCQVAILENAIARYFVSGKSPEPIGNRHPSITPFSSFKTKDGFVIIAIGNDNLWAKFCSVVERTELIDDTRFKTNPDRTKNWKELEPILNEIFSEKTTDEWLEVLEKAGIPCGPINDVERVVKDPQIKAREMLVELEHPVAGKMKVPGIPIKFSETPGQIENPAPLLGQHTEEILAGMLGFSDNEIENLRANKII